MSEEWPDGTICSRHAAEYLEQGGAYRPRSEWGAGPWQSEPDLVRWPTRAGLPGLIWRSPVTGSLCGYAAVPLGHPYFGKTWHQLEMPLDVHGGLTFAGSFDAGLIELGAEELGNWWLGFDCAHAWDAQPAMDALLKDLRHPRHWARLAALGHPVPPPYVSLFGGNQYWTIGAVREESESLAEQLVGAANPGVADVLEGIRANEKLTP